MVSHFITIITENWCQISPPDTTENKKKKTGQNVRLTWHTSKSEAKMIELMMGQNQNQQSTIKPE